AIHGGRVVSLARLGLLLGAVGKGVPAAPLELGADLLGGGIQVGAHAGVIESVGSRGGTDHAATNDIQSVVNAQNHARVAALGTAGAQLRGELREHVGQRRGGPGGLIRVP